MRRLARKKAKPDITLTPAKALARVICAAIHLSGCSCEQSGSHPCAKMVWAAKRARRFLELPEDERP